MYVSIVILIIIILKKNFFFLYLSIRLEIKIASKSKEILSQDNSITINEAKVLAEAEYAEEMDRELKSIDNTISGGAESEKRRLLENLKELHAKESLKLDEFLSNSQQSQRNNFKRRLNQRKILKEKEKTASSSKEASSTLNENSFRMSSEDKQHQTELEASLEQLKNRHTIESQKLAESLDAKKILAENALKKRIEKKTKSKGQEQNDNGFISL